MSASQLSGGAMNMNPGFTKLCKGLAVVLIGGHIVVQIPTAVSYLALIPAKTITFGWNLITAGFVEQTIYGVVISIVGLLFVGRTLEPIWGSREFFKFIFVVNLLTSFCIFTAAISMYYFTMEEIYLYKPISGFQGILSGLLVGIKQIIPDQELSFLKIKAKWLPSLVILVFVAVNFLVTETAAYLPTLICGTYMGWIYLRYWQRKPEANMKGDPSDEFAFSTFFPEFLRPLIDPAATIFERMLCGRRLEPSQATKDYSFADTALPGPESLEASRRRERGARALEERLLAAERLKAEQTKREVGNV
ncbi:Rhomboid-like protein 19 [Salvia divinorum]|uniref:Rhomboid-like protein 19 n=1 Tax=Salvia divinorum TaxID=28513 RepID=A0ABD1FM52_SALDI